MTTETSDITRTITYATLAVTGVALCLPYALQGEWPLALIALWLCAIAVPVPNLPPWGRVVSNVTFAGTVILAGALVTRVGQPLFALIAVTAATATWDLHHFLHRLPQTAAAQLSAAQLSAAQLSAPEPDTALTDRGRLARSASVEEQSLEEPDARSALIRERLVRAHLRRLAVTLGLSLALGAAALVIRVDYSLRTLAVLTAVLLIGLGSAVAYLRRASD